MHINHLDLALPLLALAVMLGLLKALRHLLRLRGQESHAATTGQALAPTAAHGHNPGRDHWSQITSKWNPWVTRVLPVPVGICVMALACWFLAYLGWAAAYVTHQPLATTSFPPWFGSAVVFSENVCAGCLALIVLLTFGTALVLFAHCIGKCLIWPAACGCEADDHQK